VLTDEIKVKNEIFKSYLDLVKARDYFEASEIIKTWTKRIFGYNHEIKVMLYEKGLLQEYVRNEHIGVNEIKSFNLDSGLCGHVARSKAPVVTSDIRSSYHYS